MREEWPEKDELVVCTVDELKTFGAFVKLEEYEGKEGLIHISEVAPGWVKHLRDYVREGQKVVCKVLHVDPQRGHIDLSLKAVKDGQKRERINAWKREKKAKKWLALAAASSTLTISNEELAEIEMKLTDAFGSLYDAFMEVVKVGKKALIAAGVKPELADAIREVAVANVKPPSVQIAGYVELTCPLPAGVEIIKEALKKAKKEIKIPPSGINTVGTKVECFYIGAPRYKICVTASDYKTAESILSDAANTAIEVIKRNEGHGKFYRNLS
ncbi:MAG: translation initiation factor IF-2 subunit alpha [Methanophagales archaeon]|nr:translation initiation factor IF-2 subunit alpha [Methanophagales archaeon]MCW3140799.1 translation initiation factor IF-2 subunit alpha [Methanophagales archaeon]